MLYALRLVAALLAATPQVPSKAVPQKQAAAVQDTARVNPRSPRAAVAEFLDLTRHGRFDAAARYLRADDRAPDLARRLKAVLDQNLAIDLELLSPLAMGDTTDGLSRDLEQIGVVRTRTGFPQPVQLQLNAPGADPAWVFSTRTVERIDGWYGALADHWLRDRMPLVLQQPGPFGIDRWQWVTLALLVVVALIVGWVFGRVTIAIARRAARKTQTTLDDRILDRASGPLLALWSLLAYRALVNLAGLSVFAEQMVSVIVRATSAAIATWLFVRLTYVLEEELPATGFAGQRPELKSFAPLIGRVTRIFVLAMGAIAVVSQFGYSVAALITGVGIGGIAIAFAAQKTLEHPFGSLAIGLDRPIRIGDWVKIGDVEGEVEAIGLRSTRVRTLARTVVVFPNGRLAEMPMENHGVRDRILLRTRIGLTYQASSAQVRRVRDDIERTLTDHPLVWPNKIIVRFKGFGESSLDIDVIAWIATTDFTIFRAAREEIYLKFMDIVAAAGCTFAYPTRTVRLASDGKDLLPQLAPDDQLETGPGIVDGAHLHVHESEGKRD
ncbi:MAG TPA: mechanosensitive ion channel family protein [Gemmatimonadaceae bacterium]|nr:mechanosensitive ion channel family protein [Gemmatimonadaceae bacterium]